jgi:hypothetical protein
MHFGNRRLPKELVCDKCFCCFPFKVWLSHTDHCTGPGSGEKLVFPTAIQAKEKMKKIKGATLENR